MFKVIKYEDIDNKTFQDSYILIDVRSPNEYNAEMIPNSINIPLFSNEEREAIGTTYMKESIDLAKKMGIEAAAKKLPEIYEKILQLNKEYNKLILFCARGGFRSSSLVPLFMTLGINALKLDKGYKGYRRYINENLPKTVENIKFVVLYGNTGAGKTDILNHLKAEGKDILDLEGCANHRGSILGGVGLGHQNSQKIFESLIYESLKNRKTDLVFVEGESKKIGKVIIPEYIYSSMNDGINICIEIDIEYRIDNILKDYVHGIDDEIVSALSFLTQQLGANTVNRYKDMVDKHNYREVIKELMIKYYDPHYEHKNRKYTKVFTNEDSEATAKKIIQWVKEKDI